MPDAFPEIRSTAFTLVDDEGMIRGSLSCLDGRAGLSIGDGEGRLRLQAGVSAEGDARLLLADAAGTTRIGMDLYSEGPSFFVLDEAGNVIIGIDFQESSGDAILSMYDSEKQKRLSLSINTKVPGSQLELLDGEGKMQVTVSGGGDVPGLSIQDDTKVRAWICDDSIFLSGPSSSRFIKSDGDTPASHGPPAKQTGVRHTKSRG